MDNSKYYDPTLFDDIEDTVGECSSEGTVNALMHFRERVRRALD